MLNIFNPRAACLFHPPELPWSTGWRNVSLNVESVERMISDCSWVRIEVAEPHVFILEMVGKEDDFHVCPRGPTKQTWLCWGRSVAILVWVLTILRGGLSSSRAPCQVNKAGPSRHVSRCGLHGPAPFILLGCVFKASYDLRKIYFIYS